MTIEEKIAQLGSVWMGASGDGDGVAPMQDQFFTHDQPPFEELIKNGLGQLTRVFGTRPVTAAAGMRALASLQARVAEASRLGIPAVAHEECLTGFAAWGATIFPPRSPGAPRSIRRSSARCPRPSARRCTRSASTRVSPRCSM
jgi:beta-xylosidase